MLFRLSKKTEIKATQKALQHIIQKSEGLIGEKIIGFPGGNMTANLYTNGPGDMWCAFQHMPDSIVSKYWNAFGFYDELSLQQQITVEINIPTEGDTRRVSGYFAKSTETGAIYLMHTGKIGGGKKGIGKDTFLAFSNLTLTKARERSGKVYDDILISRIDSDQVARRIQRFTRKVKDFKDAVRSGGVSILPDLEDRTNDKLKYSRESSGARSGRLDVELDYISYHGDVVEALKVDLEKIKNDGCQIANNRLIDLMTTADGIVTAIFEVKTSLHRQALYIAIGQILTHSAKYSPEVMRFLVIPVGNLPNDISACLKRERISVINFSLKSESIAIESGIQNPFIVTISKDG